MSKVLDKAFLDRLLIFFNKFQLLSKDQFGFGKKLSTIEAINTFVDGVVEGLEVKECNIGVFLDLSKAFDCVHRATFLQELKRMG